MRRQPKKPTLNEELVGRLAVIAIAAILAITATGMIRWGLLAFKATEDYHSQRASGLPILTIVIAVALYAAAGLLTIMAFRPNDRRSPPR